MRRGAVFVCVVRAAYGACSGPDCVRHLCHSQACSTGAGLSGPGQNPALESFYSQIHVNGLRKAVVTQLTQAPLPCLLEQTYRHCSRDVERFDVARHRNDDALRGAGEQGG